MSSISELSLKPEIPDLPFVSINYKKPGLPDYTGHFFRIITRPIVTVEYIAFLLAGRQGSGKTTFIAWTAEKIQENYGAENCNIVGNKYGDLDVLMDHIDAKPVQVLVCDDAYGSLPKDLNRKFTRIRHVFEEKLKEAGQPLKGVIYAFYAVQDYFQLEPRIRRTVNGTIFKSSVLNPYDKALFKRILEEEGFQKLEEIDFKILYSYDHAARSLNIITLQGLDRPGYIISGVPKNPNIIRWIEREEPVQASETGDSSNVHVGDWIPKPLDSWHDPDFLNEIIEEMDLKRSSREIAERDKEIFLRSIHETTDRLAAEYGVSPTRIGQIIRRIKRAELGYAAERAYHKRHPDWEYHGGNSPLPDFIDHANRRVISFKAYIDSELTARSTWITKRAGREEKKYALEHGYSLEMHVYELCNRNFYTFKLIHKKEAEPKQPLPDPHLFFRARGGRGNREAPG